MPVKVNPTQKVKCSCGKNTIVDVKSAKTYVELTRFVCTCEKVYHIIDHINGIICYYVASPEVDKEYLEQNRKKCSYPLSEFYTYADEVPKDVKISNSKDCEKCNSKECDLNCCLVSETQLQRNCFNRCPKCNATDPDITWGDKDWADSSAWQNATCNKCGCQFSEVYQYVCSEIDDIGV